MEDKFQNPFKSVQLDEGWRHLSLPIGLAVGGYYSASGWPSGAAVLTSLGASDYIYNMGLKDDIDSAYKKYKKNTSTYGKGHSITVASKEHLDKLSKKYFAFSSSFKTGKDYLDHVKKKQKESLAENSSTDTSTDLSKDSFKNKLRYLLPVPAAWLARSAVNQTGIGRYIPLIPEILAAHYAYTKGLKSDLHYTLNKYIENRDLHGESHPETVRYKSEYNRLAPRLKAFEKQHKWFVNKVKSLVGNARNRMGRTGKGSTIPFEVSNTPYQSKLPVYRE